MTVDDLKQKRFIHIDDDIEFRTHADVMRLFGTDKKVLQAAFIRHPHEEGTRVWFPMFYDDDNNDWINTATKDYSRVFEKKKEGHGEYLASLFSKPDTHRRILFAKIRPANRIFYKFKGILSSTNHCRVRKERSSSIELPNQQNYSRLNRHGIA